METKEFYLAAPIEKWYGDFFLFKNKPKRKRDGDISMRATSYSFCSRTFKDITGVGVNGNRGKIFKAKLIIEEVDDSK